MSEYSATIGLEIHAQLKTETKLFSASPNDSEQTEPNSIVSPIDAGHPGTLPALNKKAVEQVLRVGLAVNGNIASYTEWDRKNYFYPDIPKSYQISQYKYPLITGGSIAGFELTRIHLEEDTGKSIHVSDDSGYSLVNFNRAGMPLMELVTEPVIHTAEDAVRFAKELQLILRYLDAGEANLEKGEMRIEANISVSTTNQLGTKVEVKNLNSFKSVEKAIDYEINRHIKLLESGGGIIQETRGWDEEKEVTFSQRAKEDAHDYRYFPDPDIPKLYVSEVFDLEDLKASLPELPAVRRIKLENSNLSSQQAAVLVSDQELYNRFQYITNGIEDTAMVKKVANILTTNLLGLQSQDLNGSIDNISNDKLFEAIYMYLSAEISSSGLDIVLVELYQNSDVEVEEIVDSRGLRQNNNQDEMESLANKVINEFPNQVAEYQAGNENILKFLMGQGMKLSKGTANPQILSQVIQSKLD